MEAKKISTAEYQQHVIDWWLKITSGSSNWNSTSVEYTITKTLFYLNEGTLLDVITKEYEKRVTDGSAVYINQYYNAIQELIKQTGTFCHSDILIIIEGYIKNGRRHFSGYNFENYATLKKEGLLTLQLLNDFDSSFRGTITKIHRIGEFTIIEAFRSKDNESLFYEINIGGSTSFESIDSTLLYSMLGEKYYPVGKLMYDDYKMTKK